MAEVVHRNLESMLPELEELERSGIFSHQEIRVVVRRRRNHEYKLLRKPARKQDFLSAIQYELHLDMLRRHRKKKLAVVSMRYDAEFGIQNRINSLFRRSLKKFKGDLKLWLQYVDFAKQNGRMQALSSIFGKVLALHPTTPGLWIMAAKFEFEEQKNTSSARTLLQQGLRANPESKHLWLEYFRMELMHTDKVRKRRSILGLEQEEDEKLANMSDEFLSYQTASLVCKQAIKKFPSDVEFRLAFLPIYWLFEDTALRQQEIYDSLQRDFPSHPLTWEALARRAWANLDPSAVSRGKISELEKETDHVFSQGLAATVGEDAALLWKKYIEWCFERLESKNRTETEQKKDAKRLLTAFKKAAEERKLSETMFQRYLETVLELGGGGEVQSIALQATSAHPQSVPLWLARLRACGGKGGRGEGVDELCSLALAAVPEELSLPIWRCLVEHSVNTSTNTEDIFQACLGQCRAVSVCEAVAILYLDWAYLKGGIKKARRVYKRLLDKQKTWSVYQKCISLELECESSTGMATLRELFEGAVREFGACKPELWLSYIAAEARRGGVENVGSVHWRAVKCLQPELTERFISEYAAMQAAQ